MSNGTETTAERLADLTRLVRYVLWNIATDQPDECDEGFTTVFDGWMTQAIQQNAQALFNNVEWVSGVVAKYAIMPKNVLADFEREPPTAFVENFIADQDALNEHLENDHDGEYAETLCDARGIPVGKACWKCETFVKLKFRPEIFTDSDYETYGEQIEPDEEVPYGGTS